MRELGHRRRRDAATRTRAGGDRPSSRDRSDALLRISLFGAVRLMSRSDEVRLASRNSRALLVVLALDQRPRFRDSIAADLWPELPDAEASSALRQALWLLKSGMVDAGLEPAALLECDKERIGVRADAQLDLDVARFESYLLGQPALVEEAIRLYAGDLAEGINLECLARDRERLADLFEDALAEAARCRMEVGDIVGARDLALRLVRRDPLREEAHTVLIELYGMVGSRSQVSRQYRRLRGILAAELNVEPLRETENAYQVAIGRAAARSEVRATWVAGARGTFGSASRG